MPDENENVGKISQQEKEQHGSLTSGRTDGVTIRVFTTP